MTPNSLCGRGAAWSAVARSRYKSSSWLWCRHRSYWWGGCDALPRADAAYLRPRCEGAQSRDVAFRARLAQASRSCGVCSTQAAKVTKQSTMVGVQTAIAGMIAWSFEAWMYVPRPQRRLAGRTETADRI